MSGWLPPGCTDKDIDDAAPQQDMDECDFCHELIEAQWGDNKYRDDNGDTWVICNRCAMFHYNTLPRRGK